MSGNTRDPRTYFVLAYTNGPRLVGTISQEGLDAWKRGDPAALEIQCPLMYIEAQDGKGGVQKVTPPLHNARTKQDVLLVHPFALDVIGRTSLDFQSGAWSCPDAGEVWNIYFGTLTNLAAARAGIVAPSPVDIAKIKRLADIKR